MPTPDVYMIGDRAFQIDCPDGTSFTFAPSRFGAGRVELLTSHPTTARCLATSALLSGFIGLAVRS